MLSFSAIHVRGRNPDADRKPVKLVHYIRAADRHAAILAMHGMYVLYACMHACMYVLYVFTNVCIYLVVLFTDDGK